VTITSPIRMEQRFQPTKKQSFFLYVGFYILALFTVIAPGSSTIPFDFANLHLFSSFGITHTSKQCNFKNRRLSLNSKDHSSAKWILGLYIITAGLALMSNMVWTSGTIMTPVNLMCQILLILYSSTVLNVSKNFFRLSVWSFLFILCEI